MNDSSSFSETILNVFKERICTPIPYLSKTYNNASLWDKPLKMYEQIEKNQLAVESVIIEAKKHDSFFNGINTPKLYHALLCRVYILVYYKHRDDPLYKEIVLPRLRDNMGIYNSQHLKTINEKIDEILRQEELIKKALQKKKTNNNKPKFSLPKLSKTQLDELFDEYNEEQLFRDFVKFYDEVLHPDDEILDCAELWYGAKDLLKKLNAVRHPESYIERILQQYAEEIGHIGSAEPQYIVMCAYIMMRPLRSIHFAKTIERIEGYIKRDSEYYYLRDSLPNIIRWITTAHPYDVEYNYDMEYLYEKQQETEQTFTKTEVEQMMQSQSNNVVQLENELREAQKSISELEVGSQERNSLSASDQAKIAELTNENEELKNKFANQNDVVKLESEISRLVKEHEDMIVELLKPIFYGNEKDICEFLKIIEGRKDSEITDVVYDWVDAKKISEKSKGRSLWTILHAAKMYQATEQNWNTALRNHPSNKR